MVWWLNSVTTPIPCGKEKSLPLSNLSGRLLSKGLLVSNQSYQNSSSMVERTDLTSCAPLRTDSGIAMRL